MLQFLGKTGRKFDAWFRFTMDFHVCSEKKEINRVIWLMNANKRFHYLISMAQLSREMIRFL